MGRDDNKSHSNNKNSLPQTPGNLKLTPKQAQEEFSRELDELEQMSMKNKSKNRG